MEGLIFGILRYPKPEKGTPSGGASLAVYAIIESILPCVGRGCDTGAGHYMNLNRKIAKKYLPNFPTKKILRSSPSLWIWSTLTFLGFHSCLIDTCRWIWKGKLILTARRWTSKQKNKTKQYKFKQIDQYFGLKTNLLQGLKEKYGNKTKSSLQIRFEKVTIKTMDCYCCWFSHDFTTKLSILPRFRIHGVLEQLKTNFQTNFRSKSFSTKAWIYSSRNL